VYNDRDKPGVSIATGNYAGQTLHSGTIMYHFNSLFNDLLFRKHQQVTELSQINLSYEKLLISGSVYCTDL